MKKRQNRSMNPSTILVVRQVIIGSLITAFLGLLISSVWFLTRIDALTITEVAVTGGETISHEEVEKIVRTNIEGTYLKIIPRSFSFMYPHKKIMEAVNEVERIKNLTIIRSGGTKLVVEFDEYIPNALWCKESASEGCFFLDENGYSFAAAPSLSGGSFLRFVAIGKDPTQATQPFLEEEYKKIQELKTLFAQSNWYISKAEIDVAGDAFLTLVEGGEFKVSLKQSAKETVDNLLTVLGSEKFIHIKPGNFEYVDLRFGSKVFVNEVTIDKNASTTPDAEAPIKPDSSLASEPVTEQDTATAETIEEDVATSTE